MHTSKEHSLSNCIRFHRKKTGLNQRELGVLLGYSGEEQISRHERFESLPPFVIAVAYEVMFRVPITDLFPEVRDRTEQEVCRRIEALKEALEQRSGKGRHASITARKLEWIAMRDESIST